MFSFARAAGTIAAHPRQHYLPFARDRKGVTAVETALILPLVLLVLLGVIEFGRTMMTWNEVGHALGKAVRVVNIDTTTTTSDIVTLVENYLQDVNTDALSVSATTTTISGTDFMKITVSFPFDLWIPLGNISSVNMSVETLAPIMSATK